jgi:uncharacterized protein
MVGRDRRDDGRPEQARPRDRTGRPLPYGTQGVATIDDVATADPRDALLLGALRWRERRFFEAHELLEVVWKAAADPERELWKGVIQVAVACVHVQRGNLDGASRLVARALGRIDRFEGTVDGLDVGALGAMAVALARRIEVGGDVDVDLGSFPVAPGGSSR